MNKPKAIGTAAESAVVKYLHSIGYTPQTAMRKTLSGASDVGDVWCHHAYGTLIIEVKGGEQAKSASHGQIEAWLAEAVREADNARLDTVVLPVLVTQTRGVGLPRAGDWRAWVRASDFFGPGNAASNYPICFRLRDLMSEYEARAA